MAAGLRALKNLARAASAGDGDVAALVPRLKASLSESFALEQVEGFLACAHDLAELCESESFVAEACNEGHPVWAGGRLAVPLLAADGIVGVLLAERDEEPDAEELELLDVAGTVIAVLVQRSLAVEELERLSRLKSQFIALASHELRAPAAVIHGVAKTVVARGAELDSDRIMALHETLAEHTDRMARLIEDLLDLSRLEAKAIVIERHPLPVRERVVEIVETVAGERSGEIQVDVPADLEPMVDPAAFDRIVGNLITNALRYGRLPISVRAVQNDRHFRLSVEDHGDGVAPGFVPKLFDRFSRDPQSDDAAGGSGLGLSIAQAYAQAHGGQVFYEDVAPHGARFQLVLPAR